jgi:hypothetical protein
MTFCPVEAQRSNRSRDDMQLVDFLEGDVLLLDKIAASDDLPSRPSARKGSGSGNRRDPPRAGEGSGRREVGGRADHSHPEVGADAHGNHVLGDELAGADAGIDLLRHDVSEAVVDDDLDVDVGVLGQDLPKCRQQPEQVPSVR